MSLDLSSLEKALASLKRAIDRAQDAPDDEELRDAVIQRFEYSYELSWKMVQRQIREDAPSALQAAQPNYKDLMRQAAAMGMVENVEAWFDYREKRNMTSHTYNQKKAKAVYETALDFYPEAKKLLEELEQRNRA